MGEERRRGNFQSRGCSKKAEDAVQQATIKVDAIRRLAQDAGVTTQAVHFKALAEQHAKSAKHWLITSAVIAASIVAFASYNAFANWSLPGNATGYLLLARLVSRAVVLSICIYALAWSSRNYKAHRHNEVVNRHRETALVTYEAFTGSPDEKTRETVMVQATQAIFSAQPTGYLPSEAEPSPHGAVVDIVNSVRSKSD